MNSTEREKRTQHLIQRLASVNLDWSFCNCSYWHNDGRDDEGRFIGHDPHCVFALTKEAKALAKGRNTRRKEAP